MRSRTELSAFLRRFKPATQDEAQRFQLGTQSLIQLFDKWQAHVQAHAQTTPLSPPARAMDRRTFGGLGTSICTQEQLLAQYAPHFKLMLLLDSREHKDAFPSLSTPVPTPPQAFNTPADTPIAMQIVPRTETTALNVHLATAEQHHQNNRNRPPGQAQKPPRQPAKQNREAPRSRSRSRSPRRSASRKVIILSDNGRPSRAPN